MNGSSRPLQARADTTRDFARQRTEAIKRDGNVCRFERWVKLHHKDDDRASSWCWADCGTRATDTAHIYPRRECGSAASHVDVVLRACRKCHDAFDGHPTDDRKVRVPVKYEARAWKRIEKSTKVLPPRRKPPARPIAA